MKRGTTVVPAMCSSQPIANPAVQEKIGCITQCNAFEHACNLLFSLIGEPLMYVVQESGAPLLELGDFKLHEYRPLTWSVFRGVILVRDPLDPGFVDMDVLVFPPSCNFVKELRTKFRKHSNGVQLKDRSGNVGATLTPYGDSGYKLSLGG